MVEVWIVTLQKRKYFTLNPPTAAHLLDFFAFRSDRRENHNYIVVGSLFYTKIVIISTYIIILTMMVAFCYSCIFSGML